MSDEVDPNTAGDEPVSKSSLEQAFDKWDAEHKSDISEETPDQEPIDELPKSEGVAEEEPVDRQVPKSDTFEQAPDENLLRDVLVDVAGVVPTTYDKQMYLKAMLNDEPIKLGISLCGGEVKVDVRARTTWEQTCIYAAVRRDTEEKVIDGMAAVILQLQKYGCLVMIENFGGKPFDNIALGKDTELDKCVDALREKRSKVMDDMLTPKWSLLLNALRVFETKIATMGSECLNENFWTPAD